MNKTNDKKFHKLVGKIAPVSSDNLLIEKYARRLTDSIEEWKGDIAELVPYEVDDETVGFIPVSPTSTFTFSTEDIYTADDYIDLKSKVRDWLKNMMLRGELSDGFQVLFTFLKGNMLYPSIILTPIPDVNPFLSRVQSLEQRIQGTDELAWGKSIEVVRFEYDADPEPEDLDALVNDILANWSVSTLTLKTLFNFNVDEMDNAVDRLQSHQGATDWLWVHKRIVTVPFDLESQPPQVEFHEILEPLDKPAGLIKLDEEGVEGDDDKIVVTNPEIYCGSAEDVLAYMRLFIEEHVKGRISLQ